MRLESAQSLGSSLPPLVPAAEPALEAFLISTGVVALAEIGDKTQKWATRPQVAAVALAAQYQAMLAVVAGPTFGMALANIPVVYFGERIAGRFTVRIVHRVAAALFATIGLATLAGAGSWLGF